MFYSGKYYRFGEGHKSFISDKTEYEDFYAAVEDRLREMSGVNMVTDIVNGTINVMYINDRRPVEQVMNVLKSVSTIKS